MQLAKYEDIQHLAQMLERIEIISQHDADDHKESWSIAHGLSDIESSFYKIFLELIPLLKTEDKPENQIEILLNIREEFRHIKYHVNDICFFSDL